MAFKQKTWSDRVAEFINRRILTKEDGTTEIVTVARSEGEISVEGDAFNAETMNDLEQRVADEFSSLNETLTNPNGERFYFDYQDGKAGYNTSPDRGADTFFPFNSGFAKECGYAIVLYQKTALSCVFNSQGVAEAWGNVTGEYIRFEVNGNGTLKCYALKDCTILAAATNGTTPVTPTVHQVTAGQLIGDKSSTTNSLHMAVMVIDD